jgi:hypothetical protein
MKIKNEIEDLEYLKVKGAPPPMLWILGASITLILA